MRKGRCLGKVPVKRRARIARVGGTEVSTVAPRSARSTSTSRTTPSSPSRSASPTSSTTRPSGSGARSGEDRRRHLGPPRREDCPERYVLASNTERLRPGEDFKLPSVDDEVLSGCANAATRLLKVDEQIAERCILTGTRGKGQSERPQESPGASRPSQLVCARLYG